MDEPDAIRVRPGRGGRLVVIFPYTEARVARIKSVSGCRWHPEQNCWTVPHTAQMPRRLLALFSGDHIRLDPSLRADPPRFPGRRPPLRVVSGASRDALRALEVKLRQQGRSPYTVKTYVLHIKRFLSKLDRHPRDIRPEEVRAYVRDLEARESLSASYSSQAVSAIRFFYRRVLGLSDPLPSGGADASDASG